MLEFQPDEFQPDEIQQHPSVRARGKVLRRQASRSEGDISSFRRDDWSSGTPAPISSSLTNPSAGDSSFRRSAGAGLPGSRKSSMDMVAPTITQELTDKVLTASVKARRHSYREEEPSLAQLHLTNMRLHGRENDLKLLNSKLRDLNKVQSSDATTNNSDVIKPRPQLLLVAGASGTGKSALVHRGLRDPSQRMGMVFAGGKFDLNHAALPLSAFVDAMSALTKKIAMHENVTKIRKAIHHEFGVDTMLLARAMPGCKALFVTSEDVDLDGSCRSSVGGSSIGESSRSAGQGGRTRSYNKRNRRVTVEGKEALSRLQYAIRRLLKVICTNLKGVVLFIDDLQWTDIATLDLIQSISLDTDIPSLLLVGAYRDDEVPESHPLAIRIREKERMGIAVTTIAIGNLSADNVKSLVAEALGMEGEEDAVSTLALTVHDKTEGNAFFVLLFLGSLYDDKLLQYSFGVMNWRWDDEIVRARLMTQNVATIMVNKLGRFEDSSQNILKVASCLGASFSTSVVAMVVESLSSAEVITPESFASRVIAFEEEGLWEREGWEEFYCFSHDQIKSAAFDLIPEAERDAFRHEIGTILMNKLDPLSLEESLFVVVSLRNCAKSSLPKRERQALAKMNLRAGLKAAENAAFDTAAIYFKEGRQLLGATGWDDDPITMLHLCSEGADACFVMGEVRMMYVLLELVLSWDIHVKHKFKLYVVKIRSLQSEGKFQEAIDTAIEVRRQLGLATPPNKPVSKITVMKEYVKTTRALKNRSANELADLPDLTHERTIMGQRLLELMLTSTYHAQPSLFPLISFLMVRTSIRHGINASSCVGFGSFGHLLCGVFGKLKEGRKMAKTVELILAQPGMHRMKSRSIMLSQAFIYHWSSPLQGTLSPLLEGYQFGLQAGDIESAGWNLFFRCEHSYYNGYQLDGLQHEFQTAVDVLSQLKLESHRLLMLQILYNVKKLQGLDIEEGDVVPTDLLSIAAETNDPNLRASVLVGQLEMCVFFNEWESAVTVLLDAGDLRSSATVGRFLEIRFTVLEALISLKAAQSATAFLEKRKWKKRGVKSMKLIRRWVKAGNVNIVHSLHLLSAELAVLKRNDTKAEESFKSAISVTAKTGVLQDKGLAHELAGAYFDNRGDEYWAKYHTESSQEAYTDWGASAKVEQLTRKCLKWTRLSAHPWEDPKD